MKAIYFTLKNEHPTQEQEIEKLSNCKITHKEEEKEKEIRKKKNYNTTRRIM